MNTTQRLRLRIVAVVAQYLQVSPPCSVTNDTFDT
jgi:hypothetical protein